MGLLDFFEEWSNRRAYRKGYREGFLRSENVYRELEKIGTLEELIALRDQWQQDPERFSIELRAVELEIPHFVETRRSVLEDLEEAGSFAEKMKLVEEWREDPDIFQREIAIAEREISATLPDSGPG